MFELKKITNTINPDIITVKFSDMSITRQKVKFCFCCWNFVNTIRNNFFNRFTKNKTANQIIIEYIFYDKTNKYVLYLYNNQSLVYDIVNQKIIINVNGIKFNKVEFILAELYQTDAASCLIGRQKKFTINYSLKSTVKLNGLGDINIFDFGDFIVQKNHLFDYRITYYSNIIKLTIFSN